jgi:hypothetical protein
VWSPYHVTMESWLMQVRIRIVILRTTASGLEVRRATTRKPGEHAGTPSQQGFRAPNRLRYFAPVFNERVPGQATHHSVGAVEGLRSATAVGGDELVQPGVRGRNP